MSDETRTWHATRHDTNPILRGFNEAGLRIAVINDTSGAHHGYSHTAHVSDVPNGGVLGHFHSYDEAFAWIVSFHGEPESITTVPDTPEPDALLARIDTALDGTTPGPWRWDNDDATHTIIDGVGDSVVEAVDEPGRTRIYASDADAALIAAAPSLLSEARAVIAALTERAETAEAENAEWSASSTGQRWAKERAEIARLQAKVDALSGSASSPTPEAGS